VGSCGRCPQDALRGGALKEFIPIAQEETRIKALMELCSENRAYKKKRIIESGALQVLASPADSMFEILCIVV